MEACCRRLAAALVAVIVLAVPAAAQAAPAWLAPQALAPAQESSRTPGSAVEMDEHGNAVAAFGRGPTGTGEVQFAQRPAGGSWSAPVKIADTPSLNGSTIQIADGPNGTVAVTWNENESACCGVFSRVAFRDATGTWTTHELPRGTSSVGESHIAFDAAGNLTALFGTDKVWAQTRSATTGLWGPAVELGPNSEAYFDLDVAPNGRAIVVWTPSIPTTDRPSGNGVVRVSTRSADGVWDAAPALAYVAPGTNARDTRHPNAEILDDGRAVITWMNEDRSAVDPYHVSFQSVHRTSAAGAWSAVTQLTPESPGVNGMPDDATPNGAVVNVARMELDGDGDATAVWTRRNGVSTTPAVETRDFSFASGWGDASWFYNAARADPPAIATNADGDSVAVFQIWNAGYAVTRQILSRTRTAGQPWSAAVPVTTAEEGYAAYADVAIDGAGNGLLGYERDPDDAGRSPMVAGFDAVGPKLSMTAPDGVTGRAVQFGAEAVDVWSPPVTTSWTFGTGEGTGTGSDPTHTYASPGSYTVTATATDAAGNATTQRRTIEIGAPGPAWLRPATLHSGGTLIHDGASGFDATGNAVSAYAEQVGSQWIVRAIVRPAGGDWGPAETVATLPNRPQQLTAERDPSGRAVVGWNRNTPGSFADRIEAATRSPEGTWSSVHTLGELTNGDMGRPVFAFEPDGDVVALWWHKGTAQMQTALRSTTTGMWTAATNLGAASWSGSTWQDEYDLDTDASGRMVAAWANRVSNADDGVSLATRGADGTWSPATRIAQNRPLPITGVKVDVSRAGAAVVAFWQGGWQNRSLVAMRRSAAGAAFSSPTQILPAQQRNDYNSNNDLDVGIDDDGDAVVAFTNGVPFNGNVNAVFDELHVVRSDDAAASGWGASTFMARTVHEAERMADEGSLHLAVNAAGDAVLVSEETRSGAEHLRAWTRQAGQSGWNATTRATTALHPYDFTSLGIDAAGNALLTWIDDGGNDNRSGAAQQPDAAMAQGFDGSGPRLTLSAPDGEPGKELTFSATATDVWSGSSPITWSFGDASAAATGTTVKHTYASAGKYDVSIQATDGRGNLSTRTRAVDVAVNEPPVAAFTLSKGTVLTGETVTLDASGSSADTISYDWDLGDGFDGVFTAQETLQITAPPDPGTITLGLKVKDAEGVVGTAITKQLVVQNRAPELALGSLTIAPASPKTGEDVTFTTTPATDADGTIESYEWDLDGDSENGFEASSDGTTFTRQFARSVASRSVRVRAVDDDGGRTQDVPATLSVANRAPTAIVTPAEVDVHPGDPVTFAGAGSSDPDGTIAAHEWDLDGDPATGTGGFETTTVTGDKTATFDDLGDHVVRLRVRDDEGAASAPVTSTVHVTDAPIVANEHPTAHLGATPNPAKTGETVTFSAAGSGDADGTLAAYEWDLDGDGAYERTTSEQATSRSFDGAGTRTVRLRVIDNRGARSEPVSVALVVNAPAAAKDEAPKSDAPKAPTPPPAPRRLAAQTATNVAIANAKRTRTVPSVLGMHVDKARALLDKSHYVDYEIDWVHRTKRSGADIGDVVDQSPEAGDREDSGMSDLLRMELKVYAGPKDRDRDLECGLGKKAIQDLDYDLGRALIAETKCKWDEDFAIKDSVRDPQYDTVVNKGGDPTGKIEVPGKVEHQGLFLFVRGWRKGDSHQLDENWKLIADGKRDTCFAVMVQDRTKSLVANATVKVDVSDAGGEDVTTQTNAKGLAWICAAYPKPNKENPVDVIARAPGRNGHTLVGGTMIATRSLNGQKTYRNTLGQTIDKNTGKIAPVARAADLGTFLQQAASAINSLLQQAATIFTGMGSEINARAAEIGNAVAKGWAHASTAQRAVPANVNPGGLIGGGASVIAAGGGNVIAAGGGNVIAAGGGNVIAAGGGNFFDRILAYLRGAGEASVIAAGGGNVIAAGGGNVIAAGGGNVIAAGGGNVIAAGGGNRSARAAQAKETEWVLAAQGKVISVPAKGAIVTTTDCEILLGAGQFTSCRYDVRDVEKSNVVQPDPKQDVWVLDKAE